MTIDAARRSALLATKLGVLVREHAGEAPCVFGTMSGGAALVRDEPDGRTAWVLADERPGRVLGPAMAWARQQGCDHLEVLLDDAAAAGIVARRAACFRPAPGVWQVTGRRVSPAVAAPVLVEPGVDPRLADLAPVIVAGGASVVIEHGVLAGEVAGLEVCRAVLDPDTGEARLEVGVGAHDREAFTLMHGNLPTADALARVVAAVAPHRAPGAQLHPLNRLGAERLLRHRLIAEPALVGAAHLAPASPPEPRTNLKDPVPCVADGWDASGRPIVVVCSTGIDLDLVPFAADARLTRHADARLVVAVPVRDRHPITVDLASRLDPPADVIGLDLTIA